MEFLELKKEDLTQHQRLIYHPIQTYNMQLTRLDSCRSCGTKISIKKMCNICSTPKMFECKNCMMWKDPPHECIIFLKK